MRSRARILIWGGLATCLFTIGCGESAPSGPKWPDPVKVTGKVTYKGKPFENGTVIFVPEDQSTPGQGGAAVVKASGEYLAQSRWTDQKMKDGLIPGNYKVGFSRMVKPDGSVWLPDPNSAEGPASVGAREELPPDVSNPGTSPHKVTISADKSTYDFDVP